MEEILGEMKRAKQLLESGELNQYGGEFVAILDGRVVGHGKDEGALRQQVAESARVHPERMATLFVDNGEWL
jgi:hypothetical protein